MDVLPSPRSQDPVSTILWAAFFSLFDRFDRPAPNATGRLSGLPRLIAGVIVSSKRPTAVLAAVRDSGGQILELLAKSCGFRGRAG